MTLTRVKSALGISDSSQDSTLKALLRACYRAFSGPQGLARDFARRSWRVRIGGAGGTLLQLPVWPIESISSVAEGADEYDTTIAADDYEVAETERQCVHRFDGWNDSSCGLLPGYQGTGAGGSLDYQVECIAGWLMPDEVSEWSASLAVTSGDYVRSSEPSLYLFQAGSSGSMAASEPTWPSTLGGTVASNGITFTARAAMRLPDDIEEAALLTVKDWYGGGLEIPAGIRSESVDGMSVTYDGSVQRLPIPAAARAVLAGYR